MEEIEPLAHGIQGPLLPETLIKVPAKHDVHEVLPSVEEYVPVGHWRHEDKEFPPVVLE